MSESQRLLIAAGSFAMAGYMLAKSIQAHYELNPEPVDAVADIPRGPERDNAYVNAVFTANKQTDN